MPTAIQQLQDSLNDIFGYRTPRRAAKAARSPDPHRKARETAKRLAAAHGIGIERESSDAFWVWPPESIECDSDQDPLQGSHFCADWSEVLESVQVYAAALETI